MKRGNFALFSSAFTCKVSLAKEKKEPGNQKFGLAVSGHPIATFTDANLWPEQNLRMGRFVLKVIIKSISKVRILVLSGLEGHGMQPLFYNFLLSTHFYLKPQGKKNII